MLHSSEIPVQASAPSWWKFRHNLTRLLAGKTTVARLYAKILCSLGILKSSGFEETTGSKLSNNGVTAADSTLQNLVKTGGGVFFIDEAYQLTSGASAGGRAVLEFLLAEMENKTGLIVFIFAGYSKPMESFMAQNPGIPSRIPYQFTFADYNQQEFNQALGMKFARRFKGKENIEEGASGLFCRIVATRLDRQRGIEGFGNMRDLENRFSKICARQATRIRSERQNGNRPDDFRFTRSDLIGPDPAAAMAESGAWQELQEMIGLQMVKDQVKSLSGMIQKNYQRELAEKPPLQVALNRVFLGSPGTGKTTVAKIYGQVLADMGILSNGEGKSRDDPMFFEAY